MKIEKKINISTKVKINRQKYTVTKRCFENLSKSLKNNCEEVHFLVKLQF